MIDTIIEDLSGEFQITGEFMSQLKAWEGYKKEHPNQLLNPEEISLVRCANGSNKFTFYTAHPEIILKACSFPNKNFEIPQEWAHLYVPVYEYDNLAPLRNPIYQDDSLKYFQFQRIINRPPNTYDPYLKRRRLQDIAQQKGIAINFAQAFILQYGEDEFLRYANTNLSSRLFPSPSNWGYIGNKIAIYDYDEPIKQ